MKRRDFFSRLAAGIVGVAIAPRIAAEITGDPELYYDGKKVYPPTGEPPKDYSSYNDQCFHGKKISWNEKGFIRAWMDHGPIPRIHDIVMINILDDHHLPIMAVVTAVEDPEDGLVTMITLDKNDPEKMVDIVNNHNNVIAWKSGMDTVPGWIMVLKNEDAFMGICTAFAFADHNQPGVFRYVDLMTKNENYHFPGLSSDK